MFSIIKRLKREKTYDIILSDGTVANNFKIKTRMGEMSMCARKRLPADERKKEIRDIAKTLFLEKGFRSTTMEDVVKKVGMSKGGVYRHYKNTSQMLYDLMLDGNEHRYQLIEKYIAEHPGLPLEDLVVEISVLKLLDQNEYKSLYAIFLLEAEKNFQLKELQQRIMKESKEELLDYFHEHKLPNLECLLYDEWIAFVNAMIVATENLSIREIFLKNKDFFKDIVQMYIENQKKYCKCEKK